MKCYNCNKPIAIMTPPALGICSEDCLSEWTKSTKEIKVRPHRDTSSSPAPQREVKKYG